MIIARLKAPLFSSKLIESYQVASTYLLPLPSTLVGALGYALAQLGYCKPSHDFSESECYKRVRELVDRVRAFPTSQIARTSVILRRLRHVLEESRLPSSVGEITRFTDAMVREYSTARDFGIIIIPRDAGKSREIYKIVWLIERLGDSESLVSIDDVRILSAEKCDGEEVNIVIKAEKAVGGGFTVVAGLDEDYKTSILALPLVSQGEYYRPESIKVDKSLLPIHCVESVRIPNPRTGW